MAKVKKDDAVLLTAQGLADLKVELIDLKDVKRKEVAKKIQVAIEYGDLSENAEYDEAKNEQALIESRIVQIDHMIKKAQIIKDDKKSNTVKIGCTIVVTSDKSEGEAEYNIVGSVEADPLKGKISNESPVGKTLLGKKKGDAVNVKTPSGVIVYTIKEIKH
jgi:transcription elongation factor GreA